MVSASGDSGREAGGLAFPGPAALCVPVDDLPGRAGTGCRGTLRPAPRPAPPETDLAEVRTRTSRALLPGVDVVCGSRAQTRGRSRRRKPGSRGCPADGCIHTCPSIDSCTTAGNLSPRQGHGRCRGSRGGSEARRFASEACTDLSIFSAQLVWLQEAPDEVHSAHRDFEAAPNWSQFGPALETSAGISCN